MKKTYVKIEKNYFITYIVVYIAIICLMFYAMDLVKISNRNLTKTIDGLQNENFEITQELKEQQYENFKLQVEYNNLEAKILEENTFMAKVTAYSPLDDVNGINSYGDPTITATGMPVGRNVIAVDPEKIPYGTKLKIEGFDRVFIAGDTGGAMRNYDGYAIDVFVMKYHTALQFGVQYLEVTVIEWGE